MDINSILYPVHTVAKYTGFAAYTISSKTSRKYSVKIALAKYTIQAILLAFLAWCCREHLHIKIPSIFFNMLLSGAVILKHISICVSIMLVNFWPDKIEAVLKNLHQLELGLKKHGCILPYRRLRLNSYIILMFYISTITISTIVDYLYFKLTRKISQISLTYADISIMVSVIYFILITLIINNMCAAIRRILTQYFLFTNNQNVLSEDHQETRLKEIRNIYESLMDTCEKFNRILSLQILLELSIQFGYIIVSSFSFLEALIHNNFEFFTCVRLVKGSISVIKLSCIIIAAHNYQEEV